MDGFSMRLWVQKYRKKSISRSDILAKCFPNGSKIDAKWVPELLRSRLSIFVAFWLPSLVPFASMLGAFWEPWGPWVGPMGA